MGELTPKEVLQAIADGKKLDYRFIRKGEWCVFNPLDTRVTIEDILNRAYLFRLAQEMITIGDVSFPKPESEPLECGTEYWIVNLTASLSGCITALTWIDSDADKGYLSRGLIHLTEEKANDHAKALIKLNRGDVDV